MAERPNTSSGNRSRTPPPNETRRNAALAPSPRPKPKDSSGTLCRNITIYGFCRYEGKGCSFNHDPHGKQNLNGSGLGRGKFNVDSPSFTPSTPPKNVMSPKSADAAPFTPKSTLTATPPMQPQFHDPNSYLLTQAVESQPTGYSQNLQHAFEAIAIDNAASSTINPYEYNSVTSQVNPYSQGQMDMFYQPSQGYQMPLNYHHYAPRPPYQAKLLPFQKNVHSFFLSDNLREELQRKMDVTLQTFGNASSLPTAINEYHSLVPLDTTLQKSTASFGYPSWVYKAFSTEDGNTYALRRLEGFRLANEGDIRVIQRWKKVFNANIVTIHNAWTTTKFGDGSSIVFVYDYHPMSKTLQEAHFGPGSHYPAGRPVPENVLWSYMVQITSALKTIHGQGLSAKVIELSKILYTGKVRIRLNCCGILDVIRTDQRSLVESQQEDFMALGKLMLILATGNVLAAQSFAKSVEQIGKQYSANFRDTIMYLTNGQPKAVDKFAELLAPYILQDLNSSFHQADSLESELSRELENGRIVRLLCKFGFINERPEFDHDIRWSETGDRYYIKLFRDYVFHSVDEQNNPVIDLAHVLTCLNKLDAGVDEKIMLVSRDSLNCFVMSYKDLKRIIESAFQDLLKQAHRR